MVSDLFSEWGRCVTVGDIQVFSPEVIVDLGCLVMEVDVFFRL